MKVEEPKKIAFLDRDGVININAAPHQYVTRVEDFVLTDHIVDILKKLQSDGFEFIIVTNQRGVARGFMTIEDLDKIHSHLTKVLKQHNIELLDIFYCPHNYNECNCRKPKDGLLRQATTKYSIDLEKSLLISDSKADIDMSRAFGIKNDHLVITNHPENITY